jgi:hypothetical protein
MTVETLKSRSLKDLAQMAKKRGVPGWHGMRKDQLVKTLVRLISRAKEKGATSKSKVAKGGRTTSAPTRRAASASRSSGTSRSLASRAPGAARNGQTVRSVSAAQRVAAKPTSAKTSSAKAPQARSATPPTAGVVANGKHPMNGNAVTPKRPRDEKRLELIKTRGDRLKNLATTKPSAPEDAVRDRLVAMVRDPYWLHAYWELSRNGVRRAEAALGQEWHTARPVLRLLEVSNNGTTSSSEKVLRDIDIHGGVNNWYVDVQDPPRSFRLDIGYLATSGRMFVLARSNIVSTPRAGACDSIDENWTEVAENFDKIYAMSGGYANNGSTGDLQELFEERLRRPMGSPMLTRFGAGANGAHGKRKEFGFELDAELIVYGSTEPGSHVTLQGDPVKLRSDGTFTVRFSLPNSRQVIPAVASSADGVEQRTVILAVERNTKTMEPLVRENNE